MNYNQLILMASDLGHLLLSSGAEIYRVEESMNRLLDAYGVEHNDVFAIPNCIFVTLTTPEGETITKIRRVHRRANNLDRVDRANDLCRRICREKPPVEAAAKEIRGIASRPVYGVWTQTVAFCLVSFFFTLFWGGVLADAVCSVVCSICMKGILLLNARLKAYDFLTNLMASAVAALIATSAVSLGLAVHYDKIIIGALMTLVPGITITTFMRDIMAGDLVAGLQRLTESLLVATAIALGVGLVLMAPRLLWGV